MKKMIHAGILVLGVLFLSLSCATGTDEAVKEANSETADVSAALKEPLILEAEDAVIEGGIVDIKHAGFTGDGFVDFKPNQPGGTITWNFDVPVEGNYFLVFRYAHAEGNRPLEINVNGEIIVEELEFMGTGDWAAWDEVKTKAVLKAGENSIVVTGTGASGGGNIDHLKIVPDNSFSMIYEAETAEMVGGIVDIKHAGFTGDGFFDFKPNQPGGTITWTCDLPQDGDYNLIFRYAHAEGNRPLEVQVNGAVVAEELEFMGTGDWANWEEVSLKTALKAGENKIMVTAIGASGGGNLDHLEVVLDTSFSAIFEAEEAVGTGTIIDIKHAGFTGDGFVDFKPNQPGGTLQWEVEVPGAGEYTLQFRYAHAEGNRPLEVQINGTIVEKELAFMGTGDWANWQTVNMTAELEGGKNVVLVTGTGASGGGNIDHLKIVSGGMGEEAVVIDYPVKAIAEFAPADIVGSLEKDGSFVDGKKGTVMKKNGTPAIESVKALTDTLIMVTFDSGFLNTDAYDIMISAALGEWNSLNPKLSYIPTKAAAIGANAEGKSVYVYQLEAPYQNSMVVKAKKYTGKIDKDSVKAENIMSWQMDHGGWYKNNTEMSQRKWDGKEPKGGWVNSAGTELGTIDNNATINEIRFLAEVYRETGNADIKASVMKGIDFLLTMQYDNGGFPQVYPKRDEMGGLYSNYVTFNDGAMMNVMIMFDDMINIRYPFDSDLVDSSYNGKLQKSIDGGIDYILKSQIKVNGELTAWCAQHDPETYEPRGARTYEHPSISGYESVNVVKFLMGRPKQTPAIKKAVDAAVNWLDEVKMENTSYISADKNKKYFVFDPKGTAWYRFYDLKTMEPIFSGRDGVIKRTIQEIEEERADGYSWGGSWPTQLLQVAQTVGNFEGKFYAVVVSENSSDLIGQTLTLDSAGEITP